MSQSEYTDRLDRRRRDLGISVAGLARRSGVSRATVIRMLAGEEYDFSFANLQAILRAMGMSIELDETPADQFRDQVATEKAKRLVALTQGNVALEAQAVSQRLIASQVERAKSRIASSNQKLWAS